jgi:hypothetical protein
MSKSGATPGGCPLAPAAFRFGGVGPFPSGFERYDALRDEHPVWRVEVSGLEPPTSTLRTSSEDDDIQE